MESKYQQYAKRTRICVGVDVHKVNWSVTIIEGDQVVKQCSIPGSWNHLQKQLSSYRPEEVTVSYEAGYFGYHLHDAIEKWGGHCVVVAPSLIPQEIGNRVKVDRKDSYKLSFFLSKELLKPVYVPGPDNRADRQLIRTRSQFMADRRRIQCRIKSRLSFLGIAYPNESAWSPGFVTKLKQLRFETAEDQISFEMYLNQFDCLTQSIQQLTQQIQRLAQTPKYQSAVEIVRSVPGIGTLSAMEFLLEIDDIDRFESADRLAAYLGLTPSQYSSGEKTCMGRITKSGKKHLRGTLVEAAWTTIQKDSGLRVKFERFKQRSGSKRAIVAIARNLVIRLWHLLKRQEVYQLPKAA